LGGAVKGVGGAIGGLLGKNPALANTLGNAIVPVAGGLLAGVFGGGGSKPAPAQSNVSAQVRAVASATKNSVVSPKSSFAGNPAVNLNVSTGQKWYQKIPVWAWVVGGVAFLGTLVYLLFFKRKRRK
jgi:hypothetical protein